LFMWIAVKQSGNRTHASSPSIRTLAINVLVNNAVRGPEPCQPSFEDVPPESWRLEIRANLEGYYFTIQQTLPYILANNRRYGHTPKAIADNPTEVGRMPARMGSGEFLPISSRHNWAIMRTSLTSLRRVWKVA